MNGQPQNNVPTHQVHYNESQNNENFKPQYIYYGNNKGPGRFQQYGGADHKYGGGGHNPN